jgi:hypothetical protein
VALLLERGASPNEQFFDKTPWQNTLSYAYTALRPQFGLDRERLISWLDVFTLLIEHGAKTDEFCDDPGFHIKQTPKGTWQRQLSVLWIVNSVFMTQIPEQTARLYSTLVDRGCKKERRLVLQNPKLPSKGSQLLFTSMMQAIMTVPSKTLDFWSWSSSLWAGRASTENSIPPMSHCEGEDEKSEKLDF